MEPFIGQIMLFAGNYAPRGWAVCDGRLLSVQDYSALFSILGTTYGGDGRTTFGIPDLRGRVAIGYGHGPGLTSRLLGERSGYEYVSLNSSQMPVHNHSALLQATGHVMCNTGSGEDDSPAGNCLARTENDFYSGETPDKPMNQGTVQIEGTVQVEPTGGGAAHANMQPYQALNYCIALVGDYPPRD